MTSAELGQLIAENWQVIFLYGLKILNDTNKNINYLDKIVAVHDSDIKTLKQNRRAEDKKL